MHGPVRPARLSKALPEADYRDRQDRQDRQDRDHRLEVRRLLWLLPWQEVRRLPEDRQLQDRQVHHYRPDRVRHRQGRLVRDHVRRPWGAWLCQGRSARLRSRGSFLCSGRE